MTYSKIYTNKNHVICLLILLMQCININVYAAPIETWQLKDYYSNAYGQAIEGRLQQTVLSVPQSGISLAQIPGRGVDAMAMQFDGTQDALQTTTTLAGFGSYAKVEVAAYRPTATVTREETLLAIENGAQVSLELKLSVSSGGTATILAVLTGASGTQTLSLPFGYDELNKISVIWNDTKARLSIKNANGNETDTALDLGFTPYAVDGSMVLVGAKDNKRFEGYMTEVSLFAAPKVLDVWTFGEANTLYEGENFNYDMQIPAAVSHANAPNGEPALYFDGTQSAYVQTTQLLSGFGDKFSFSTRFNSINEVSDGLGELFSIGGQGGGNIGPAAMECRIYPNQDGTTARLTYFLFGNDNSGNGANISDALTFNLNEWYDLHFEYNEGIIHFSLTDAAGNRTVKEGKTDFSLNAFDSNYLRIGWYGSRRFKGYISAFSMSNDLPDALQVINGDCELPGDTWIAGGGLPDHWDVSNFEVSIDEPGQGNGSVGLNHRWNSVTPTSYRSMYLINPNQAIIEHTLTGTISTSNTYEFSYSFFRYHGSNPSGTETIVGRLYVDDELRIEQIDTAADFPYREWQTKTLPYTPRIEDFGKPVTIQFELTSAGDTRIDDVKLTATTPITRVLQDRLNPLITQADALPQNTEADIRRSVLLDVLIERTQFLMGKKNTALFDEYIQHIEEVLAQPSAITMNVPQMGVGFFPAPAMYAGNPFYEHLMDWSEDEINSNDVPWNVPTSETGIFNGIHGNYGTRKVGNEMTWMHWSLVHPESNYQNNPELLRRLIRRILTYSEDYLIYANSYENFLNDFFAIDPAFYATRIFMETYPDMFPPSIKSKIDAFANKTGNFWYQDIYLPGFNTGVYRMGKYCNRDLAVANILLNTGMYLNNQDLLDAAQYLVDAQEDNLFPDGAFAYLGVQNASVNYHDDGEIHPLGRYYSTTGYQKALDLIEATEYYSLLSTEPSGVAEFNTSPQWKTSWNTGASTGTEIVAGVTANPYVRTLIDQVRAQRNSFSFSLVELPFYRDDVQGAQLPDNYTIYDRNIQGRID